MKDITRVNVGTIGHVDYGLQLALSCINRSLVSHIITPELKKLYLGEHTEELLDCEERTKLTHNTIVNSALEVQSSLEPTEVDSYNGAVRMKLPSRKKKRTKSKSRAIKQSRRNNRR